MAPARRTPIAIIAIFEFCLWSQMVLGERLGVGFQLIGGNWLSRFPIEGVGGSLLARLRIGCDRSQWMLFRLSRRFRTIADDDYLLVCRRQRGRLKATHEIERLDP